MSATGVDLRGCTLRGLTPTKHACATSRPSARDVDRKRPSQAPAATAGSCGMSRAGSGGRPTVGTYRRSVGPVVERGAWLGLMQRQKCWPLVLAFRMQLSAARVNVHSSVGRPISGVSQGVLRMLARSVRTAVVCAALVPGVLSSEVARPMESSRVQPKSSRTGYSHRPVLTVKA